MNSVICKAHDKYGKIEDNLPDPNIYNGYCKYYVNIYNNNIHNINYLNISINKKYEILGKYMNIMKIHLNQCYKCQLAEMYEKRWFERRCSNL